MTKTEQLSIEIQNIYAEWEPTHDLQHRGPQGGRNAKTIPGWERSPNATCSRALKIASVQTMEWFEGYHNRPTLAIPAELVNPILRAYQKIFLK